MALLNARRLARELYGGDDTLKLLAASFKAGNHWRQRFCVRWRIRPRKRTNKKITPIALRLPRWQKYHRGVRRFVSLGKLPLLIPQGDDEEKDGVVDDAGWLLAHNIALQKVRCLHNIAHLFAHRACCVVCGCVCVLPLRIRARQIADFGRFPLHTPYCVDQVPLPFVIGNDKTFETIGSKSVVITQPTDGLEKRQATLQLCFRPVQTDQNGDPVEEANAVQPRACVIFRGKGVRIKASERAAWAPDVDVLFQENAWVNRAIAVKWTELTWARQIAQCHTPMTVEGTVSGERTILFADNLEAQTCALFKEAIEKFKTSLFFYPPNETDVLAPLDAGFGKDVKSNTALVLKWTPG